MIIRVGVIYKNEPIIVRVSSPCTELMILKELSKKVKNSLPGDFFINVLEDESLSELLEVNTLVEAIDSPYTRKLKDYVLSSLVVNGKLVTTYPDSISIKDEDLIEYVTVEEVC